RASEKHQAPLLPVPISSFGPSDPASIAKVIAGHAESGDGGAGLDSPVKVLGQVSRCRVVVTGGYHAAVFALAQGIPAVALARSAHSRIKLQGLQTQFGGGCPVLDRGGSDLAERLEGALSEAWLFAEEHRPRLLEAARRQIDAGHAAFRQ